MARRIREPSCRNLIVYIGAVVKQVTQKRVAEQFGIGQGRVSQIVGRVRAWVDQVVGERHFRKQPVLRFYLAICKERLRLEQMYGPVMTIYDERTERERYARRYVAVVDGKPTPTVEITERSARAAEGSVVQSGPAAERVRVDQQGRPVSRL